MEKTARDGPQNTAGSPGDGANAGDMEMKRTDAGDRTHASHALQPQQTGEVLFRAKTNARSHTQGERGQKHEETRHAQPPLPKTRLDILPTTNIL